MYTLVTILIILACILLILIILVQNSKGGGLASNFAGGNQFGGVVQTNKFLEKATWTLAIALLVLSLLASLTIPRTIQGKDSRIKDQVSKSVDYNAMPNLPNKTQGTQQNATQGTQQNTTQGTQQNTTQEKAK